MCVFFRFFRTAVRAFSLACPAYYCFITLANKREREREQLNAVAIRSFFAQTRWRGSEDFERKRRKLVLNTFIRTTRMS